MKNGIVLPLRGGVLAAKRARVGVDGERRGVSLCLPRPVHARFALGTDRPSEGRNASRGSVLPLRGGVLAAKRAGVGVDSESCGLSLYLPRPVHARFALGTDRPSEGRNASRWVVLPLRGGVLAAKRAGVGVDSERRGLVLYLPHPVHARSAHGTDRPSEGRNAFSHGVKIP